jgi:hypothetical protein
MKGWKKTTEEGYWDALECLPPAIQLANGFLLGEPTTHRTCTVTGKPNTPTFPAFITWNKSYFAGPDLTVDEFKAVKPADMARE